MKRKKSLIKEIVQEIRKRQSGASGEYEDYEIEVDDLAIPGIVNMGDYVLINITIGYEADGGCEGKTYGPPENCYPGEGASVDIIEQYPVSMKVTDERGQEVEWDVAKLTPEQLLPLRVYVEQYVNKNQSDIEDKILNSIDFDAEPDYDEDRDDDRDFDR
jgi:hypothetical protein